MADGPVSEETLRKIREALEQPEAPSATSGEATGGLNRFWLCDVGATATGAISGAFLTSPSAPFSLGVGPLLGAAGGAQIANTACHAALDINAGVNPLPDNLKQKFDETVATYKDDGISTAMACNAAAPLAGGVIGWAAAESAHVFIHKKGVAAAAAGGATVGYYACHGAVGAYDTAAETYNKAHEFVSGLPDTLKPKDPAKAEGR